MGWNADPAALRDPISDSNPKIDFLFKFKNKDRSVDSTFTTGKGTSRFPDIAFNTMPSWTNSLRQLRMDTTFSSLIMERVISACVQTSAQVYTMDRTVVKTTPTSCWSLVSAHCSPNPTSLHKAAFQHASRYEGSHRGAHSGVHAQLKLDGRSHLQWQTHVS